ncbi:far upstream element-binding protein 3 isoform X1 [Anastrepha obliqua]|uniref:far upstream element-binding protein 3 isoform X1 n=1 Tax=Anastrepha obliqua TaxID=95512 RepID=UPI00240A228D|nr:far upstream element-binding protein 3 isoform X1 [Anastrepha obliqua]
MSEFAGSQSNLNQSQAFAAALQRAKQIAAKIQPNTAQGSGSVPSAGPPAGPPANVGFKRSHEDGDSGPEMKRFTSPTNDYNNSNGSSVGGGGGSNPGSTNISQALAQATAVAQRLAATAGTTVEEQIRIPESLVNSVLGRGSTETITQIQGESGCKVQLSQDQDRVVTLRGSRETVTKGRELFQQLSNRNGGGNIEVVLTINMPPPGPTGFPPYQEIMIPGTKVGLVIGKGGDTIKQLQEKTGAKMVIIQDGPNQEIIKPLRISGDPQKIEHAKQAVLDLIAQKDLQAAALAARNNGGSVQGSGGGSGGYNFGNTGEQCEVFVPKIAVGVVIGKGGDMIRKIQTECGCKLQFIQGKNDEPGDRRCLIQGTRQQVDDAKRMIDGLIENMMQRQQRNANSNNNSNGNMEGNNSNYGYGYGVNHAQQPPREEITFMVPSSKCGIVIGRGGETIKLINQQSGAYCEMDRNAVNPPSEKLFKCKGTSEQVEAARQMIAEKINMELPIISRKPISGNIPGQHNNQGGYGQNPMQNDPNAAAAAYQQQWGGYAQGWGDQSQQQQMMMGGAAMGQNAPAAGGGQQADYSAQWIEYYKSMGMMREAEMIEQQLKAKQGGGNPGQPMGGAGGMPQQQQAQPQPQQQPQQQQPQQQQAQQGGGTADYSAQWAEYYRSIGKIAEAEAIEKQMKQGQNGQANAVGAASASNNAAAANNSSSGNNSGAGTTNNPADGGNNAALQGMTPSQYAQYSQYYAAAAAQASQAAGGAAPGYPQQAAYGGYGAPGGGYPGAPQPNMTPGNMGGGPNAANQNKQNKGDKN